MSRLIDADAMANRLRDSLKEHPEWHHMTMGMIDGFIKEIEEEPTAYDVEKVVAELTDKMLDSSSAHAEAIIGMCYNSASVYSAEIDAYSKAIDIVKAGGINE